MLYQLLTGHRLLKTSIFCALFMLTQLVWAANITTAKQAGLIGEQPNGYLALVVASAPSDVRLLIVDINNKRKSHYQKIAQRNGLPLASVEKIAGKKAIKKTKSGQFIRLASGQWRRK
ncbi:MAG: YdbL family protein [Mariprofundaceae bacterium]|nr:YdbL family protein [Mariprofundaceae bacterium]